jgi:hypothetical protein
MCESTMLVWFELVAVDMQLFVTRPNNFLFRVVKHVEFPCYLQRAETGVRRHCSGENAWG